eukprot:TRINITY_DN1489_c0_g2_i1.p1 TRINITY_DN1489_c0_g2~~TRINITY_DN1489_c0_g2_i1.p1  ORF type:complete len:460 (+),score=101.57 TRINITY_DN1489_c0_g2_i1:107-1486(+)
MSKEDDCRRPIDSALENLPEHKLSEAGFVKQISPLSDVSCKTPSEIAREEMSQQAEEVKKKWRAQEPGSYVLVVGVVLAGCAGFVNAAAMLTCGSFVSHVTGTTAKLGMAVEGYYTEDWEAHRIYQALLLLLSFLVGAIMCGLLVSRNEVHFGKSAYGVALCLNSCLLLTAVGVFDIDTPRAWPAYFQAKWLALYLQSAACGLQNGMCTAHFGAVVRTTHLTGLMTDSGLTIGRVGTILLRARCNRRNFRPLDSAELYVDLKKLIVFAGLLFGYIAGVCAGAAMADVLGIHSLFIPAAITGVGGLIYSVIKARCWEVFERAEAEKLVADLEEAEEIFARAMTQIEGWKVTSPRASSDLEDLDSEVGKALHLLHDMEACLQRKMSTHGPELHRSFSGRTVRKSASDDGSDAAKRIHSAPVLLRTSSPPTSPKAPNLRVSRSESFGEYAKSRQQSADLYHV